MFKDTVKPISMILLTPCKLITDGDVQTRSSEGSSPRSSDSPKQFAPQQQITPRSSPASVASARANQVSNGSGDSRSPSPQCKKRRVSVEGGNLESDTLTSATSIAMSQYSYYTCIFVRMTSFFL